MKSAKTETLKGKSNTPTPFIKRARKAFKQLTVHENIMSKVKLSVEESNKLWQILGLAQPIFDAFFDPENPYQLLKDMNADELF